ncbi:hypothetical protein Q8F55_000086 [Vanrija albida]|uniref:Uncharacterized protein n=1 Tax=Vanrija albida TaxID=181172 RepID=A0ABR3QCV9_9TREE
MSEEERHRVNSDRFMEWHMEREMDLEMTKPDTDPDDSTEDWEPYYDELTRSYEPTSDTARGILKNLSSSAPVFRAAAKVDNWSKVNTNTVALYIAYRVIIQ